MAKYIEELVARQVHKSELARQKEIETGQPCTSDLTVITISRKMGSGAHIVAEKLASELGWSLWSKELINAIAQDADISRRVVEAFDEKSISEIELFARSVLGDYEMGDFLYQRHLARAIASIAKLGNAIILGRGANFLLPDVLHFRIDASEEHRIQNMIIFENLTRKEAEEKIKESDKDREQFLIRTFGKECYYTTHYDLSIWMDKFSVDNAARIIKTAIDTKRLPACK